MVISRTPFRISFFGGGTDYPHWYKNHGGEVLATTINKYCYLTCRFLPPFFNHRIRLVYSKIECCNSVEEILHPSVRETLRFLDFSRGIEIHHDGDLPARSGMGSSSAFTVGLLNALQSLQGKFSAKKQLSQDSLYLEQSILKETVGSQDQVMAAYGGLNHIVFHPSEEISVRPVIVIPELKRLLASHLMLFYTGIKRTASDVAGSYVDSLSTKESALREIRGMVDVALSILSGKHPLSYFGELLHEAWKLKRSLGNKISNSEVDAMYDAARSAGALGGKLTGAGGGGFLLLFADPLAHGRIKEALHKLTHVPFEFEPSGSQIIYYDQGEDFSEIEKENANRVRLLPKELHELSSASSSPPDSISL